MGKIVMSEDKMVTKIMVDGIDCWRADRVIFMPAVELVEPPSFQKRRSARDWLMQVAHRHLQFAPPYFASNSTAGFYCFWPCTNGREAGRHLRAGAPSGAGRVMRHLPNNTRLMACSCATALAQQRIYSMDSDPASQLPRLRQAYIIPPRPLAPAKHSPQPVDGRGVGHVITSIGWFA
jgi:hypothetical protein